MPKLITERTPRLLIAGSVLLLLAAAASAQPQVNTTEQESEKKTEWSVGNGIVVGAAKYYDERSLRDRLDRLRSQLGTGFPDTNGLYTGVGNFQGSNAQSSALALKLTAPLAVIDNTLTDELIKSSVTDAEGERTDTSQRTVTDKEITQKKSPAIADLSVPGLLAAQVPTLNYNLSPYTRLNQQVEIAYQLSNLSLLLERSITDRSIPNGNKSELETRRQAVLGFQISVDNRDFSGKEYKNAVAEVELSVKTLPNGGAQNSRISLVQLLPERNSYNVSNVTQDAKQLGLGAVFQLIGFSATSEKKKSAVYLVQDTDTVALEMNSTTNPQQLNFGWQFRPVLGRQSVEPGVRQVYAAISLPNNEVDKWQGEVSVRTRWRRYNAKTRTVGDIIPLSQSPFQKLPNLTIPSKRDVDSLLDPIVTDFSWQDLGNGKLVFTANGENYTSDTTVVTGEANAAKDGTLAIFKESRMRFILPVLPILNSQSPVVYNSYGETKLTYEDKADYQDKLANDPVTKAKYKAFLEGKPRRRVYAYGEETGKRWTADVEYIGNDQARVTAWIALRTPRSLSLLPNSNSRQEHNYVPLPNSVIAKNNHVFPVRLVATLGGKVFGFNDAPIDRRDDRYIEPAIEYREDPADPYNSEKEFRDRTKTETERTGNQWTEFSFVAPAALVKRNEWFRVTCFLWGESTSVTINLPKTQILTVDSVLPVSTRNSTTDLYIMGNGFESDTEVHLGTLAFSTHPTQNSGRFTLAENYMIVKDLTPAELKDIKNITIFRPQNVPIAVPMKEEKKVPSEIISNQNEYPTYGLQVGGNVPVIITGKNLNSIAKVMVINTAGKPERVKVTPAPDGLTMTLYLPSAIVWDAQRNKKTVRAIVYDSAADDAEGKPLEIIVTEPKKEKAKKADGGEED